MHTHIPLAIIVAIKLSTTPASRSATQPALLFLQSYNRQVRGLMTNCKPRVITSLKICTFTTNQFNMYQARVNASANHEVTVSDGGIIVDGKQFSWDLARISDRHYHILLESRSYNIELVSEDPVSKTFVFKLNGTNYVVELRDKFDLLLDKMGLGGAAAGKVNNVKAPMPGLIIELRVVEGQSVQAGEPLLILEAMKMENIIKAPADSIVKSVKIKKGDSVEKSQILIEF